MPQKSLFRTIFIISIISLNISCDRITKSIVRVNIPQNSATTYLNNHLTITRVENTGAFLSAGSSLSNASKLITLNILPLLALSLAVVYIFTRRNLSRLHLFAISCIIGGGIGNVYDRVLYGSVTDFLYMDFTIFHTGIFNLADVSLMLGVAILLFSSVKKNGSAYRG